MNPGLGGTIYRFGDCELDAGLHELRRGGHVCSVEPQAFDLLLYLIENRDRLVGKEELNEKIWSGRAVSDASLSTSIKLARQAIGDSGKKQNYIRTLPRRGFRFVGTIDSEAEEASISLSAPVPIAVLPFENLSNDPEQDFFADGLTDDLITHLSKLDGILVISRNSVFTYKGRNVKARDIAEDLGVRYVLEGSVRRAGGAVRINAQLIDAERDIHVWADLFDRTSENIFALQDDVMSNIVAALKLTLTPEDRETLATPPTRNLQAYDLYLKARQAHYLHMPAPLAEALALYQQASGLDPEFADAHAGEAAVAGWAMRYNLFQVISPQPARKLAEKSIAKALAVEPGNAAALCAKSALLTTVASHDEAILTARQAVGTNSSNAPARHTLAEALTVSGRVQEGLAETEAALRTDPMPGTHDSFRTGQVYFLNRHYERALEFFESVVERDPEYFEAYNGVIGTNAELGRLAQAQEAVATRIRLWPQYTWRAGWMHRQHWHPELLDRWTRAMQKAGAPDWPYGFKGDEANRLSSAKITEVVFGHRKEGRGQTWGDYSLDTAVDGRWIFRGRNGYGQEITMTGPSWVEDDLLCFTFDDGMPERVHRLPFYRNPSGSRAEKNEYVNPDLYEVFWFSVID